MQAKFDEIDKRILEILQQNGRITMKKLGEIVHLSSPAVTERVMKMESSGAIDHYSAQVDPRALGYDVQGAIIVTLNGSNKNAFIDFIQDEDEIIRADEIPGKSDVMLHIACENYSSYLELIQRIRQYGSTDSYMYMESYKDGIILPKVNA